MRLAKRRALFVCEVIGISGRVHNIAARLTINPQLSVVTMPIGLFENGRFHELSMFFRDLRSVAVATIPASGLAILNNSAIYKRLLDDLLDGSAWQSRESLAA